MSDPQTRAKTLALEAIDRAGVRAKDWVSVYVAELNSEADALQAASEMVRVRAKRLADQEKSG